MKKILIQAAILSGVAVLIGLVLNSALLVGYFTTDANVSDYSPIPLWRDDVELWQQNQQLIVDARSATAYRQGHIPGARSLPRGDHAALQSLVDCCSEVPEVLVYCSTLNCDDSFVVGQQLFEAGFKTIFLYEEGFADWQQSGLAVEQGAP